MAESIVQEWLMNVQSMLNRTEIENALAIEHDSEIAEAIFTILNERQKNDALVHDICEQLLTFYRSTENTLHKFPFQFIPVLIYTYLHGVANGDKKGVRCVETLLICIYNGEVSTEEGLEKIVHFRMPILAQASVYHEEKCLPMTDLRRWEENCNREVRWGPHSRIEAITANNRLKVMTALLFCYNQHVSQTQKSSLIYLCRVASQLVNEGFSTKSYNHRSSHCSDQTVISKSTTRRIPLTSAFLVELSHAIYFAMFNGFGTIAIQMWEEIYNRACFEMYTELIVLTSAVRNSLYANPSGQPSDGPMGLSVALTPSTNTVTTAVAKSMITNASFRTKKLPDDIPIQLQDLTVSQAPHQLASVTEETTESLQTIKDQKEVQQQGSRSLITRPSMEGIKAHAHKALIAGFKKSKDKDGSKFSLSPFSNNNTNTIQEQPKPPQRKFDKHMQRNSLLQLQIENGSSSHDYDNGSLVNTSRNYDLLDITDVVPLHTLNINESGSTSLNDNNVNCITSVTTDMSNNTLANSNITNNTTMPIESSVTNSSGLSNSKHFQPNIELPISTTSNLNAVEIKANDIN